MNIIPIISENHEADVKPQSEQDASKTVSKAFFMVYETQNIIYENGLPLVEGTVNDLKEETDHHENPQQADISSYFSMNAFLPGMLYEIKEAQLVILPKMFLNEAGMQLISSDPVSPEITPMQNEPVISILEGNIKDIGPLKNESARIQQEEIPVELQPNRQRAVARMPQFTEHANEPDKHEENPVPLMVNGDVLCPLENANDLSNPEEAGIANETDKGPANDGTKKNVGRDKAVELPQVDLGTEKVKAAIKFEEAFHTLSKPVQTTTENLFDTMVKEIELFKTDESNQMIIQLKPEFLGKVTISLSIEDQGLHVKIRTEDPGIKSLISGQISQLAQSLANRGIRISDIDVAYSGISNQNNEQPQDRQEPQKQNGTRYRKATGGISAQALLFTPMDEIDVSNLDMMVSSVDLRA